MNEQFLRNTTTENSNEIKYSHAVFEYEIFITIAISNYNLGIILNDSSRACTLSMERTNASLYL